VKESLWAFDVLAEEGFVYDASINPRCWRGSACPISRPSPCGWRWRAARAWWNCRWRRCRCWAQSPWRAGATTDCCRSGHPLVVERAVLAGEVFMAYCHPYEFDPDEFAHLAFPCR
jgi:hypothetical protein